MITANWKQIKPKDGRIRNPQGRSVSKVVRYECTYQYAAWFRLARNIAKMDPTHEVCALIKRLIHLDSEFWRGHAISVPEIEAIIQRLETIYNQAV